MNFDKCMYPGNHDPQSRYRNSITPQSFLMAFCSCLSSHTHTPWPRQAWPQAITESFNFIYLYLASLQKNFKMALKGNKYTKINKREEIRRRKQD